MELQDINFIKNQLKSVKTDKIKFSHKLVFDCDKNHENRNRSNLQKFQGFLFTESAEFKAKLKAITDSFDQLQLITVGNILSIDIDRTAEDIADRILKALSIISCFKETFIEVFASETEVDNRNTSHNSS